MNTPQGFLYRGDEPETVRVMFIEYKGKDISFNRWRFSLYYETHMAATHFEPSAEAAERFMARHKPLVWPDYSEWRASLEVTP